MIDFLQVEQQVKVLTKDVIDGNLTEKELEEQLLQLVDIAEDGYYWMFGHRSHRWFRHNGQKWVITHPSTVSMSYPPPEKSHEVNLTTLDWGEVMFSLLCILAVGVTIYYSSAVG